MTCRASCGPPQSHESLAICKTRGVFRPEVGRELPDENLRVLRTLITRRAQLVEMRKRFIAQTKARKKQGIPANVETLDDDLQAVLNAQIDEIERRMKSVIAHVETFAVKAGILRSIPGIGPVSAAMLVAELPELGQMTAGEAAAMTGLAPVPHDSGMMRGQRTIAGGRRSLRHVLFQATLAAACHNPVLKPVAKRLKERGKPHKWSSSQSHAGWSQSRTRSSKPVFPGRFNSINKHSC